MKKLINSTVSGIALAAMTAGSVSAQCTNEVWNKVMERGKIVIGVKADYKPWGFRDESGNLVGMEIDMAKDVGRKDGGLA